MGFRFSDSLVSAAALITLLDEASPRPVTRFPKEVADKALAHKLPNKVEAAYRRTDFFEKRRNLMARWAEYLDRKGKDAAATASEPIPIRTAA